MSQLLRGLDRRARGGLSTGRVFAGERVGHRLTDLELSRLVEVESCQRGQINHLDLDPLDGRYLLSAGGDATIALYDLDDAHRTPEPVRSSIWRQHDAIPSSPPTPCSPGCPTKGKPNVCITTCAKHP